MADVWVVLLLSVISVSMAVTTVTLLLTMRDLRQILKRIYTILPTCDETVREAHRMFGQVRQVLTHTSEAVGHVETVIRRASEAASGAIEQVASLKARTQRFLAQRLGFGNGARSGPRRRRRS